MSATTQWSASANYGSARYEAHAYDAVITVYVCKDTVEIIVCGSRWVTTGHADTLVSAQDLAIEIACALAGVK
jgi:hypothetical protein